MSPIVTGQRRRSWAARAAGALMGVLGMGAVLAMLLGQWPWAVCLLLMLLVTVLVECGVELAAIRARLARLHTGHTCIEIRIDTPDAGATADEIEQWLAAQQRPIDDRDEP